MKKVNKDDEVISVSYELGATINAGNYESLRVNFGMSIQTDKKNKVKAIKTLKDEVIKEMQAEVLRLRSISNG